MSNLKIIGKHIPKGYSCNFVMPDGTNSSEACGFLRIKSGTGWWCELREAEANRYISIYENASSYSAESNGRHVWIKCSRIIKKCGINE